MEKEQVKKAFLFDLNGTMIDDMEFHGKAWFDILNNDLGANLSWEAVKKEMYGKNPELLERVFGKISFLRRRSKLTQCAKSWIIRQNINHI